jgi:hypothetical protein
MPVAGATRPFVEPGLGPRRPVRRVGQPEGGRGGPVRSLPELDPGHAPEVALVAVERRRRVGGCLLQPLAHRVVEVLEQLRPGRRHRCVDLAGELGLQGVEGGANFVGLAAPLVDVGDPPLEVDARADGAEHLVRGAEDALEERELLVEQLVDPPVRPLPRLRKFTTTTWCFWP